jgi:ribosomal-protein-alanine N-acetyltransferase
MSTQTPDEAYPRLETERLVLRALRLEDADFVFQEWGDSVVTYYMWDEDPLQSREQAEEMLQPLQTPEKMPDFKWWGIELKAEGRLIGTCGYCKWDKQHRRAEIGRLLGPGTDARGTAGLAALRLPADGAAPRRGHDPHPEPALPAGVEETRLSAGRVLA